MLGEVIEKGWIAGWFEELEAEIEFEAEFTVFIEGDFTVQDGDFNQIPRAASESDVFELDKVTFANGKVGVVRAE